MVHGGGGAAAGGGAGASAAASRSRGVTALALSARGPRPNWSSASRRLQGTFSEPVPLNATDTYPPGYPGSKHIPDERYTGAQMNGLMVGPSAALRSPPFFAHFVHVCQPHPARSSGWSSPRVLAVPLSTLLKCIFFLLPCHSPFRCLILCAGQHIAETPVSKRGESEDVEAARFVEVSKAARF